VSLFFPPLLRLFGVPGLILLLSSCATQAPRPAPAGGENWKAHRQQLSALENWQARGRIAVQADDDGFSAGFDWTQTGRKYRIRLRGPFGQGALELEGDARGVWLRRSGQATVFATNPDVLLERESGWRLPVLGLNNWLRGLPDSRGEAVIQLDPAGRLASLRQRGWRIEYRKYRGYGEYALPTRLVMQRNGLRVKLLVDTWTLP